MPEPQPRTRQALTKERVVHAAVTIIERDGEAALSMRRVATELGVAPMSLYNHVPNKAALLDGVAEFIMTDMRFASDPDADWQQQTRNLARTFRAITRRYPRSVLLVITRQPKSSVGMHAMELVLASVRDAGFDDPTSVRLVRTFVSFILGAMMREVGVTDMVTEDGISAFKAELAEAKLTNVEQLLPILAVHDHEGDFEFGLELLIGAMSALPRH
ncbi:TetR/AcrR family transcriptional regulator [Pseudonocardia spinosispora]|uniref:TetR/AcrR family transcriptional regulator n=1 Tax=Pseudonocardia spinosispora TaxID=103441 RepID=UPI0004903B85|nr:TetR/AcrR family transcriptional regulator [Pseudonocardia spinosispora]